MQCKDSFYQSLLSEKENEIINILNEILSKSMSYYNSQENFYYDFLVELLNEKNPISNRKSGDGRFVICIPAKTIADSTIIVECKRSKKAGDLIEDAQKGAQQIVDKKYAQDFSMNDSQNVIGYGIAFHKKQCYVVKSENLER